MPGTNTSGRPSINHSEREGLSPLTWLWLTPCPPNPTAIYQDLEEASRRGPPPIDPFFEEEKDPQAEMDALESMDPLRGKRVHAWILINPGKRDVSVGPFVRESRG